MDGLEPVLQTQRFISSLSSLVIWLSLSLYPTTLVMRIFEGEMSLIDLCVFEYLVQRCGCCLVEVMEV